jgi:hypothetical protein
MPILNEAMAALDVIDKRQLDEIKTFANPPIAVKDTL